MLPLQDRHEVAALLKQKMAWFELPTLFPIVGMALVLIVLYVVARRAWYGNSTVLQSAMVPLKESQPATISNLTDGAASTVTTMWWMYVNNWSTGSNRMVLEFGSPSTTDWQISMNATKPQLELKVGATDTFVCTANFPIQKWTMVSVVFDSGIIDVYIDAQLVQSFRQTTVTGFNTTQLKFGQGLDVALANVRRYPKESYSPHQIAAEYYKHNNRMQAVKYGLQINLTRDDQVASEWKIL